MKRKAIVLSAVAAVAAAAVIPAVSQSQSSGDQTITLTARTTSVKIVDLPPRARSSAGDQLVSLSALSDGSGKRVGTGHLTCSVSRPGGRAPGRATYNCVGTHALRDGSITIAGAAKLATARVIRVAVTGGTGAYDGVTGELVNTAQSDDVSTQVITIRR
jgi:hypothetical protein